MIASEKILVLTGGISSEKEIAIKTGLSVHNALQSLGFNSEIIQIGSFEEVLKLNLSENDYVFLALHGGYGEDGRIQALLSGLNIPYNGANHVSSGIGMNKVLTKDIAQSIKIEIPKFSLLNTTKEFANYESIVEKLGNPFIVKPISQGCSKGVFLVREERQYLEALEEASKFENEILLEEFIYGKEITVGILNGEILPIVDVVYSNQIFDYNTKFTPGLTSFQKSTLPIEIQEYISLVSLQLFKRLDIHDYGRLDFIVTEHSVPYLLEINTLPGLNGSSVYPQACSFANINYNEMIKMIIHSSIPNLITKESFYR